MQKSLTKFTMVLAAVLALSMVVSAQTDEGQAGQQPSAVVGDAAKRMPHLPPRICRTIRTIFPEYGWGEAEPLTR
jgi:hypothetical protein